jgi:hypothetical protein
MRAKNSASSGRQLPRTRAQRRGPYESPDRLFPLCTIAVAVFAVNRKLLPALEIAPQVRPLLSPG